LVAAACSQLDRQGVCRQARALASIGSLGQRCECHRSAGFLSDRRLGGQTRKLIVDIEL
jgi:hypothetical protein